MAVLLMSLNCEQRWYVVGTVGTIQYIHLNRLKTFRITFLINCQLAICMGKMTPLVHTVYIDFGNLASGL